MEEMGLIPAGSSSPAGPLNQEAYDFRRSRSHTDAFTCFIASGGVHMHRRER